MIIYLHQVILNQTIFFKPFKQKKYCCHPGLEHHNNCLYILSSNLPILGQIACTRIPHTLDQYNTTGPAVQYNISCSFLIWTITWVQLDHLFCTIGPIGGYNRQCSFFNWTNSWLNSSIWYNWTKNLIQLDQKLGKIILPIGGYNQSSIFVQFDQKFDTIRPKLNSGTIWPTARYNCSCSSVELNIFLNYEH